MIRLETSCFAPPSVELGWNKRSVWVNPRAVAKVEPMDELDGTPEAAGWFGFVLIGESCWYCFDSKTPGGRDLLAALEIVP